MRPYFWMLLVCATLSGGCASVDAQLQPVESAMPDNSAQQAEPRGIVGEVCPPALAAKGYC
jgi:hypothetical protein